MLGIIDYGMGNLQSVINSCEFLGERPRLIASAEAMRGVSRVILPGVGAFAEGMRQLDARGLTGAIRDVCRKGTPFLGICLGMQLLADFGAEGGGSAGLGIISGTVDRLDDSNVRVPHVGWNDIRIERANDLLGPELSGDYYFVHSYYFNVSETQDVIATCDYGRRFACAVGRGNTFGVQFHPEKSQRLGLAILKNFMRIECLKNA